MKHYHETCCALIKQINDGLEKYANNLLRENDLTMMQIAVLVELDSSEGKTRSLKWLEHKFRVAQPTMLGIVKRLEQKALVETYVSSEDRRMKLVHATEAGSEKCSIGYTYMDHTEENLLQALSPEEQVEFSRMLKKIAEQLP